MPVMHNNISLSFTEKISAFAAACVLASLALVLSLNVFTTQSYSDFIVGSITWQAKTKLQDLIVGPAFIFTLFISSIAFFNLLKRAKRKGGIEDSEPFSTQLIWLSTPSLAAIFGLILRDSFDQNILYLSSAGIALVATAVYFNRERSNNPNCTAFGIYFLTIILIGVIPIEIGLLLGRLPVHLAGNFDIRQYIQASYAIGGIGFCIGLILAAGKQNLLKKILPKLILASQITLPLLYLALYPARLRQPTGALSSYDTTIWLKILIAAVMLLAFSDAARRFMKYRLTSDYFKLLSPISFFGILVALKVGNTAQPIISPDDYHFGESLLGWWSYIQGAIPYVDYIPAHGLIDDDLRMLLSSVFFDGTAGSVAEAGRLAWAILAFFAFLSIYSYSGSVGFAFASIYFLGWSTGWLFLIPFVCLWFNPSLRSTPSKWLGFWIATAPLLVLGIPPQGLLLLASSGFLVAHFSWRFITQTEKRSWIHILGPLLVVVILSLSTSLGMMLRGAVQYLLENGPINQLSYGVPWSVSWSREGTRNSGMVFEFIRMSWIFVPIGCLAIIYSHRKHLDLNNSPVLPATTGLIFTLLLIPYSMGRIDPGGVSRPGLSAIFGFAFLMPIIVWKFREKYSGSFIVLLLACLSSALGFWRISVTHIPTITAPSIRTPELKNGPAAGLDNIGNAYVQEDHWARLLRLKNVLDKNLADGESYLDLTSRNAQYFYLNRKPILPVSAPYNMAPITQQKRAVDILSERLPKLALIAGDNFVFDGGGLSLRNPFLYRFVVESYTPYFENGFIFGKSKIANLEAPTPTIEVTAKDLTNVDWLHGMHRTKAAVAIDNSILVKHIEVGDQVDIGNGDIRSVTRKFEKENVIWLDGTSTISSNTNTPINISISLSASRIDLYHAAIFHMAFSERDIQKIPVSWGRSEPNLATKMTTVAELGKINPFLHHLVDNKGLYKVTGTDPVLTYDLSSLGISGGQAGFLRFEFNCTRMRSVRPDVKFRISWTDINNGSADDISNVLFTAENGVLIIPLDSSPLWLMRKHIAQLHIKLEAPQVCYSFRLKDVKLMQRSF